MSDWGGGSPVTAVTQSDYLNLLTTANLTGGSPMYRPSSANVDRHFSLTGKRLSYEDSSHVSEFCTDDDNIDDCVAYLNREVTDIGMPSLYKGHTFDLVQIINCMYDLLCKHQRSVRIREDLENRQHRAEVDLGHMELVQKRLKESLRQMERDSNQLLEKDRQLNNKHKLLDTKMKAEKDEVRRLQSVMQHREAQYRHEQKKSERNLSRLQERLRQRLSDKTDRKTGIEISNSLQRSDGKRGLWKKGGRDEEEMYRLVISNYEEKQKELMVENNDLRQCLSDMQKELHALLTCPLDSPSNNTTCTKTDVDEDAPSEWSETEDNEDDEDDEDVSPSHSTKHDHISDGHFQMPYEFVRDDIEKSLKKKCRQVKLYIRKIEKQKVGHPTSQPSTAPPTPTQHRPSPPGKTDEKHKLDMERLNRQIERYRTIIDQQEALIQSSLQPAPLDAGSSAVAMLHDSELWSEKEMLVTVQNLFDEQKANFEEERKNFTEAAIRLGRQRKAFEEEKNSFLHKQFLEMSPFNNRDRLLAEAVRHVDNNSKTKRRLPTTPTYAVLPTRRGSTGMSASISRPYSSNPTTAELYRTLGLTKELRDRPRSSCSLRASTTSSSSTVNEKIGLKPPSTGNGGVLMSSPVSRTDHNDTVKLALFNKHGQDDSD